jgi:hypothetical protein
MFFTPDKLMAAGVPVTFESTGVVVRVNHIAGHAPGDPVPPMRGLDRRCRK